MTAEETFRLERKIPLALMAALLVQTGGVLLWTGRAAARVDALEQRVAAQSTVAERLARLEAQGEATRAVVSRVEALLDRRAR